MESKHIPMSIAEFELMEHPFGWKAEYFSGKGHLTPREHLVRTKLTLACREIADACRMENSYVVADRATSSCQIVPADPLMKEQMIATFFEAFQDSVEFCDWSLDAIHTHASKNINNYFQGVRGKPHPASRMALEPNSDPLSEGLRQRLIGLALFIENAQERVELDLLLVKPSHQRRGIATQMVASAIDILCEDGVGELKSGYHICNDGSRAWHRQLGFEDIPEYLYCRFQFAWYRHEIWRREELGQIEQLEKLRTERDRWERLSQELAKWESD